MGVTSAAELHASPNKHYIEVSLFCLATCFCVCLFARALENVRVWPEVKRALLSITLNLFHDFFSIFLGKKKKNVIQKNKIPLEIVLPFCRISSPNPSPFFRLRFTARSDASSDLPYTRTYDSIGQTLARSLLLLLPLPWCIINPM